MFEKKYRTMMLGVFGCVMFAANVQAQLTTIDFQNGTVTNSNGCQGPLDATGDFDCFIADDLPADISFDSTDIGTADNLILVGPWAGGNNSSIVLYTNTIGGGESLVIDFTGGANTAVGMDLFCFSEVSAGVEVFSSTGSLGSSVVSCSTAGEIFSFDAGTTVITQVAISPVFEGDFVGADNLTFTVGGGSPAPSFSCEGFAAPMANGPVKVKKNRSLPLGMELFAEGEFAVTDLDVAAAPIIQVLFTGAGSEATGDISNDALPAGHGTDGNEFEFTDDGLWQFNLKTTNYSASGTYVISVLSGDDTEYTVDPTCEASFVVK